MYIKLVVLDGFKSYGHRVQVGEFDPHFNAITGFNGSGKSNILDGIVFVLGLSSLSHVRAQTLNDLIHKGGNVKRASVSLVFDNRDKQKSPIGYGQFDEIIVSRTVEEGSLCKYYLNSALTTKKVLQDMFLSVSLNVDNPNFMIMQGKITKVVNMKPKELLSMIEETVGAANYQLKRDKSVKDIQDKENQIVEMRETHMTVLQPALRRQQGAHKLFELYKIVERERDACAEKYAVCAFRHNTELLAQTEVEIEDVTAADKDEEKKLQELEELKIGKLKRQEEIKKETNMLVSEKLASVEKEVSGERKKVATHEAGLESALAHRKECEVQLERAQKAHEAELKQVEVYKRESGNSTEEFESISQDIETAKVNLASAQHKESEVNAGRVLGNDGETFDLRERLVHVDNEIGKIRPKHGHETRVLETELKSLREKEVQLSRTASDKEIENKLQVTQKHVADLQQQLILHNIVPEEIAGLDETLNEASNRLNLINQAKRTIVKEYYSLDFSYTDPTPNFNRKSVHGCVYELFELTDVDKYKVPFEVGCSGCFPVVIVDTPEVAKNLINHGNVAIRRTYMPLSTLRTSQAASQAELDRKLGQGKAVTALSLIRYDPKYDKVIKNYMGRVVLCDTMATAKIVAFQMKLRAITMDGDVCDSDGTMQGGTRRNAGNLIVACQKLRSINLQSSQLQNEVEDLKSKMNNYAKNSSIVNQFETANRKLANLTQEKQCTAYASLAADVDQLREIVASRKAQIKEWANEMGVCEKEHQQLSATLESLDEVKARNLKQAKAEVEKWTKALTVAQKKYDAKQEVFAKMDMDNKAKQAMLGGFLEDIKKAEQELAEARDDEVQKQARLDEANEVYNEKKAECDEVSEERRVWDDEMSKIDAEIKHIVKSMDKMDVVKIKRDNKRETIVATIKEIKNSINYLKKKYEYMDLSNNFEEHKELFPERDIKKTKREMDASETKFEQLKTKVDPEEAQKLHATQEQENDLKLKILQLKESRHHLNRAVEVLDFRKSEMVAAAFRCVNEEFGKMMSTLLPESTARLVPVTSEAKLEDGLNIHVRLGGVWKESLTELSGGQRSLVALALVLSLCMYQPAPFYVLDEIDAALDLSHTQNIGVLIKERFKDTQFICVSLKDGMYTNANVLFTTQFNNGKSAVTRSSRFKDGHGDTSRYQNVGNKRTRGGARK